MRLGTPWGYDPVNSLHRNTMLEQGWQTGRGRGKKESEGNVFDSFDHNGRPYNVNQTVQCVPNTRGSCSEPIKPVGQGDSRRLHVLLFLPDAPLPLQPWYEINDVEVVCAVVCMCGGSGVHDEDDGTDDCHGYGEIVS